MTLQQHAVVLLAPAEPARPYAVFAYDQPDYEGGSFPIYTIVGGPSDRSSVSAETLREMGIAMPDDAPHDHHCACEMCRMERARDAAVETR